MTIKLNDMSIMDIFKMIYLCDMYKKDFPFST